MLVSETHFTNHRFFKIPQYSFHHVTPPDGTAHGGSGVIIKSKIKQHLESTYRTNDIQATNLVVDDWYGQLWISSVYSPPKHNLKKDGYEQFFKTLGRRFIVGGDFNAKHTE